MRMKRALAVIAVPAESWGVGGLRAGAVIGEASAAAAAGCETGIGHAITSARSVLAPM